MNRTVSSSRAACTFESLERRALFAAAITGIVLQDASGNGHSIDDGGLAGVVVKLYEDKNANGALDAADGAAITSKVSGADGRFAFTGLATGKYLLEDVVPANHVRVAPLFSNTIAVDVIKPNGSYSGNVFAHYVKSDQLSEISNVSYTINGTTVTTLLGNVQQGDTVTANFTVKPGQTIELSLVAYKADAPYSNAENLQYQTIADLATGVFTAGQHSLTVEVPDCYFQVDFVIGQAIDPFGPAGSNILYGAQGRLISFANGGTEPCDCDGEQTGDEGLTPGFWKNHTDVWQTYTPNQTLESVFDVPDHLGLDDKTLLEALNFGGGSSVKGAAQNLFRHAVAAILNASHSLVEYALTTDAIITQVNAALASNSATTINALKNQLDQYNNAGGGIDAHGNEI